MANIVVARNYPSPIEIQRFVRNEMRPQTALMREVARQLNLALVHRRRVFLRKGTDVTSLPTGQAAQADAWKFHAQTGVGATGALDVVADLIFAPSDAPAADTPMAWLELRNLAGTVQHTSDVATYAVRKTSSLGMSDLYATRVKCSGVTANTEYSGAIVVDNYARLVGACVYEQHANYFDEADTYASPEKAYYDGAPIYDSDEEKVRGIVDAMLKKNGAYVLQWCPDWITTGQAQFTSLTFVNILETGSSAVTANTRGWRSQLQYHNTRGSNVVPGKLAVYGSCASASAGKVAWFDSGGSMLEVTLPTSAGWVTATGNINKGASDTFKGDLMGKGDNGGVAAQITVLAASVLEYLA